MLGICNGFQVLCEARLLPGALLPNRALRFICRQVELVVERRRTTVHGAHASRATGSRSPSSTRPAAISPRTISSTAGGDGQIVLRYAPGENPNGCVRDIAGVCNDAGNVLGLMPHPEHAVDPLDRLG